MLQLEVGKEFYFHAKSGTILEYRNKFTPSFTVLCVRHALALALMPASKKHGRAGKQANGPNLTISELYPLIQMTYTEWFSTLYSQNLAIIR
jgi:hypothetical protein